MTGICPSHFNHMKIKPKTYHGISFKLGEKDRWGLRYRQIRRKMGILNKQRQEKEYPCHQTY